MFARSRVADVQYITQLKMLVRTEHLFRPAIDTHSLTINGINIFHRVTLAIL